MASVEWALNVQNKAEGLVFKMVGETLKLAGQEQFFDVRTVWCMQIDGHWRGMITTSLDDGKYYSVTYFAERKASRVDVFNQADSFIFPD